MALPVDPEVLYASRLTFFKLAYGPLASGWATIGYLNSKGWREYYFRYPDDTDAMLKHIQANYADANVYFCPNLFNDPKFRRPDGKGPRVKENMAPCPSAWADLDTCAPDLLLVQPTLAVQTSPGRYQALWVFEELVDPALAQQLSKNIAYHHALDGADTGWALTKMLRIPYTYNFKRQLPTDVGIVRATRNPITPEMLSVYSESRIVATGEDPMPTMLPTESGLDLLQKYRRSLNPIVFSIFSVQPNTTSEEGGWSKPLWQLQMLCFEAGMSREEVFVVASDAACNKYKRDNKHPRLLWREVCRAYATTVEKLNILVPETKPVTSLISDSELAELEGHETFVERYIKWASSLGDAAPQYHQAGAFMILSSLLAGAIRLPTSFGTIMPNLWFMLLADTTLTRKSTAMDISSELVDEIEPEVLLATDGSLEGLMQSLEVRPNKPSLFLRDEVSGLIEAMSKKDYMAGMAEALTKLYDGKTMKRVLKRETVTVRDPCLLFFAGGIKTRVQSLLTLDHVASGFVPRFIFITAESDVSRLQPLGPPTHSHLEERDMLIDEAKQAYEHYSRTVDVIIKGQMVGVQELRTDAYLTDEAWARYNQLESTLLYAGVNSDQPDIMTPVYDRLSKSILKAAVLLAASKPKEADHIEVDRIHLLHAIRYGQDWRRYAEEIVNGIGRSTNEVLLQRVFKTIRSHPGVARSRLMQWYHLEARQAEILFATLEQRGLINATRMGRTWCYEAIGRIKISDNDIPG